MKMFATSDIHGNKALVYSICRIVEEQRIDALMVAETLRPRRTTGCLTTALGTISIHPSL